MSIFFSLYHQEYYTIKEFKKIAFLRIVSKLYSTTLKKEKRESNSLPPPVCISHTNIIICLQEHYNKFIYDVQVFILHLCLYFQIQSLLFWQLHLIHSLYSAPSHKEIHLDKNRCSYDYQTHLN